MRIALLATAGLSLAGFLYVAVVLPQVSGAQARGAAQALIAGAQAAQLQVAGAAERMGRLDGSGRGVRLAPREDDRHGEMKWVVEPGGAIRGWNERNVIEILLRPALQDGRVVWNCRGYPLVAMPAGCGGRG